MENLCDKWLKKYYGKLDFNDYILLDRAARTLESNSDGLRTSVKRPWAPLRGIMPSDNYFDGVWNWDCAFHAMVTTLWDPELARDQIRIFQKLQKPNGMYPDVWFSEDGSVFAGASKPPVFPWAAWAIEENDSDLEFLASAYQSFVKNEQFWLQRRGGDEYGMFFYDGESTDSKERKEWGGWESGWDDSPRWDDGVNNIFPVDLNCYMIIFYRSMSKIAQRLNKPLEAEAWLEKETLLTEQLEKRFWSEKDCCYLDYDFAKESFVKTITPASFMPLFIGTASPERARAMADIASQHLDPGWPSVSYNDTTYDPEGYWRGRTWLNISYFALKGLKDYGFEELAERGRKAILSWVTRDPGSIYENYNSQTGMPVGAPHFSWSAVFIIKFILDWEG